MKETMLKLRIWGRAEVALGKIAMRHNMHRAALIATAVGLALLTVAMINLGAYELLADAEGKAQGAFILAGSNALLAILVGLASQRQRSRPEEAMVREIREMAAAELAADAEQARKEFKRLQGHVQKIEHGLSALTGSGVAGGVAMISSVGPVLELIVQTLRNRKTTDGREP